MCVPWFSYMAFDFPGVSNCAQLGKPGAHSPPLLAQNRVSLRGRVKLAKFLLPSLMLPNLYSVTHWFFAPVEYWALLLWNLDFSKGPPLPGCLAKSAFCTCSQTTALRGWGHSQILQLIWRSVCLLPDTQEAGLLLDPLDPTSPTEALCSWTDADFQFFKGGKNDGCLMRPWCWLQLVAILF